MVTFLAGDNFPIQTKRHGYFETIITDYDLIVGPAMILPRLADKAKHFKTLTLSGSIMRMDLHPIIFHSPDLPVIEHDHASDDHQ